MSSSARRAARRVRTRDPSVRAVNSLDCTFTLSGPLLTSGQHDSPQYDVPAPEPGQTTSCVPVGSATPVSCTRSAPTDGSPQALALDIEGAPQLAAFEQAAGGTTFTVSITCGTLGVVTDDPQSVQTCVDWTPRGSSD